MVDFGQHVGPNAVDIGPKLADPGPQGPMLVEHLLKSRHGGSEVDARLCTPSVQERYLIKVALHGDPPRYDSPSRSSSSVAGTRRELGAASRAAAKTETFAPSRRRSMQGAAPEISPRSACAPRSTASPARAEITTEGNVGDGAPSPRARRSGGDPR